MGQHRRWSTRRRGDRGFHSTGSVAVYDVGSNRWQEANLWLLLAALGVAAATILLIRSDRRLGA